MINIKNVFILTSALVAASPFSNAFAQEADAKPVLVSASAPAAVTAPAPAAVTAPVPAAAADAAYVQVEEQTNPAILVKINNVKSIKDKEGLVTSCDFEAIIYNRSTDNLAGASIDLSWKDETVAAVLEEEEARRKAKEEEEARNAAASDMARNARTARANRRAAAKRPVEPERNPDDPDLVFTLEIPQVSSYGQAVIVSKLKSDKCFLLVQDAEINVRTCNSAAAAQSSGNPVAGRCMGMFEFISSKDPQYYRDFKKIDLEAEKMARLSKQDLIKQEVEADYQRALQAMDAIAKELDNIK